MNRLSFTQINQYIRCGEQYKRRYIEGDKIPPGIALAKGSSIHKTSEYNFRQKKETGKDEKKKNLIDYGINTLDNIIKNEGLYLSKDEENIGKDKLINEAQKSVKKLITLYSQNVAPVYMPKEIEVQQEIAIESVDVPIIAQLDLIDSEGKIVELKTSSKKAQENTYHNSLQLTVYSFTYHAIYKQPPQGIEVNVLVDNKIPQFQRIKTSRDIEDYKRLISRIQSVTNGIKSGVFIPTNPENWWCSEKFCGYYRTCPYVKQ